MKQHSHPAKARSAYGRSVKLLNSRPPLFGLWGSIVAAGICLPFSLAQGAVLCGSVWASPQGRNGEIPPPTQPFHAHLWNFDEAPGNGIAQSSRYSSFTQLSYDPKTSLLTEENSGVLSSDQSFQASAWHLNQLGWAYEFLDQANPVQALQQSKAQGQNLLEKLQDFSTAEMVRRGSITPEYAQKLKSVFQDLRGRLSLVEITASKPATEIPEDGAAALAARPSTDRESSAKRYLNPDGSREAPANLEIQEGFSALVAGQVIKDQRPVHFALPLEKFELARPIDRQQFPYVFEHSRFAASQRSAAIEAFRMNLFYAAQSVVAQGGRLEEAAVFGFVREPKVAAQIEKYGYRFYSTYRDGQGIDGQVYMVPLTEALRHLPLDNLLASRLGQDPSLIPALHGKTAEVLKALFVAQSLSTRASWLNLAPFGERGQRHTGFAQIRDFSNMAKMIFMESPHFASLRGLLDPRVVEAIFALGPESWERYFSPAFDAAKQESLVTRSRGGWSGSFDTSETRADGVYNTTRSKAKLFSYNNVVSMELDAPPISANGTTEEAFFLNLQPFAQLVFLYETQARLLEQYGISNPDEFMQRHRIQFAVLTHNLYRNFFPFPDGIIYWKNFQHVAMDNKSSMDFWPVDEESMIVSSQNLSRIIQNRGFIAEGVVLPPPKNRLESMWYHLSDSGKRILFALRPVPEAKADPESASTSSALAPVRYSPNSFLLHKNSASIPQALRDAKQLEDRRTCPLDTLKRPDCK